MNARSVDNGKDSTALWEWGRGRGAAVLRLYNVGDDDVMDLHYEIQQVKGPVVRRE